MNDIPTNTPMNDSVPNRTGVDTDETRDLIASDKIEGTAVYNTAGEHIGSVYNFMVDKRSGKVAYAVMSFGGFLGIGERYHPLPWDALDYRHDMGGYVVNISREQLENAPSHGREEDPWADPHYGRGLYNHYGMTYRA